MTATVQNLHKTYNVAAALTRAGVSVIPIREGTKIPALKCWKPYQQQIADIDTCWQWFKGNDSIGIIAGAISGNMEVLDFDGAEYYRNFETICGHGNDKIQRMVQSCCLIQTPSGGYHLIYRSMEPIAGNKKLARTTDNIVKIETRGEGGYVLTYPSNGYKIIRGRPDDLPLFTSRQVQLLHDIASVFDDWVDIFPVKSEPRSKAHDDDYLLPGDDYDMRGDYECTLRKHGWVTIRCNADGMCLWRRPGKSNGISASTGYGGERWFNCFTSNGRPFETTGYSPFGVYAMLECGGDFKLAAANLRELGYGY